MTAGSGITGSVRPYRSRRKWVPYHRRMWLWIASVAFLAGATLEIGGLTGAFSYFAQVTGTGLLTGALVAGINGITDREGRRYGTPHARADRAHGGG